MKQTKEYYNKLFQGDCLDVMGRLPEDSVDMVLCDLPYGVLNKSNDKARWDCQIPLDALWEQYRRVCKDDAPIVLFAQGMFTADLMESNRSMWRYNLVWDKVNPTGFLNARRMPLRSHEDICVFYGRLPVYHPQMTPYDASLRHGKGTKCFREDYSGHNGCYGNFRQTETLMSDEKFPKSIITVKRKHDTGHHYHPTEKPVELLRYLIRTYSDDGDVVLDNTMGSGSTCVAAVKEHRRFIGIEKDETFYLTACGRGKEALGDRYDAVINEPGRGNEPARQEDRCPRGMHL